MGGASLELKYDLNFEIAEHGMWAMGILINVNITIFLRFWIAWNEKKRYHWVFERHCHLGNVSLPLVSRVRAPYSEGREDGNLELQNTQSINIECLHFSCPWMLSFSILPETFSAVSGHGAG